MNTLICAGGTGARVLESVIQLCAAGLGPPALRLLVIDPDSANGNSARAQELVGLYLEGHRLFGGKLGGLRLFGTALDLLETDDRTEGLKTWSPSRKKQRFKDLVNAELLDSTHTPRDLLNLFYTEQDLELDLSEGFRGRPSIGAAAMSLVALHAREKPWAQLVEKIRGDLANEEGARVYLAGSVFGGTGSSTFFPIARFLRTVPQNNASRLRIGVGALSPYFRFEAAAAGGNGSAVMEAAKAENFPIATRGAVSFYEHLKANNDWPFDVIHWLGDNEPIRVSYAPGGVKQENQAHFVELLAALAALQFFHAPKETVDCCYSGTQTNGTGEEAVITWKDLPLGEGFGQDAVAPGLLRLYLMGIAHLGFFSPLLKRPEIAQQPYKVGWYWERFASKGDSLLTGDAKRAIELLDGFFAERFFVWWKQIHEVDRFRLFNLAAVPEGGEVRLDRLANLLWPDRPGEADPDAIDRLYTEMMAVPKRLGGASGSSAYLALLAHAADRYIRRVYAGKAPKE